MPDAQFLTNDYAGQPPKQTKRLSKVKRDSLNNSSILNNIISQCDNMQKKNVSLVTKASRQNQKFTKMKGQVQRNLDRNKGDGTNLVDDKDLLNILANYQV
jgi:hypothetical protein